MNLLLMLASSVTVFTTLFVMDCVLGVKSNHMYALVFGVIGLVYGCIAQHFYEKNALTKMLRKIQKCDKW